MNCPCGTGLAYNECCGIFLSGKALPETPEKLMRSRYTAYTQNNFDYITNTMTGPAAEKFDLRSASDWAESIEWIRLDVISSTIEETKGHVEFIAYFYDENKKRHAMHELSEFHFEYGKWFYVDGCAPKHKPPIPETMRKRNDICHCGSGKKYKKCCGMYI
jgi:SEC-C motif-containing protein